MLALAALTAVWAAPAWAQEEEAEPSILLIMDSSGSMAADDGTGRPKIEAAKEALNALVDELPEGSLVGLRVYGHRVPNTDKARGCRDTELIVPVGPLEADRMKERIRSYQARGFTPIGLSLRLGARDLPAEGPRTIILVSDGIDTCAPPPPCEVAEQLAARDIDLRIETVGFQVDPQARADLRCIAQAGGGTYRDAGDAGELAEGLKEISLRALRIYQPLGTPVQGTPDEEGAPVLGSGQYTDAISPGETVWYAVDLAEGQAVTASGTLVVVGERAGLASTAVLRMGFYGSSGEPDLGVEEVAFGVGQESQGLALSSQTVGAGEGLYADLYAEPGTYHVSVSLEDQGNELPEPEYPLELVFEVTGEAAPTPTSSEEQEARAPPGPDGSDGVLPEVLVAAAFGLLGAAGGALLVGRMGRR